MLKIITGILFFIYSLSVTAAETHLVCDGEMKTVVIGVKDSIAPDIDPITITFDENKNLFQSELLSPTCGRNQEQIDACKCTFEKTNIRCKGLSRNMIDANNIWSFNFNLNRVSGKLVGVRQFGNSGDIKNFSQNSFYNYVCKLSPMKF
jgi:hypothetical protein